jgi:Na+/proline symporter
LKDFLLWKNANEWFYAASVAATWIWAPAIFVASDKAYFDGVWGFLMFLIPNILTLILFAYFAEMVRSKIDGFTLVDAIAEVVKGQKRLHLTVSVIVLICSTCVQILGLHTLFSAWFAIPKWVSASAVSVLALAMVVRSGIKGSIQTDAVKYVIMLLAGVVLLVPTVNANPQIRLEGMHNSGFMELAAVFGVSTAVGLFSAPYADQTFWQRVFSIEKGEVKSTFLRSAVLFALIPLIFGLIGFYQISADVNWSIGQAFGSGALNAVLAFCVVAALLSTLDSNLCAIASIACREFGCSINGGRAAMIALMTAGSLVMIATEVTITDLFLLYGTIRTCVALPTILIILDRYDTHRLFYSTLACILVAPLGFVLCPGYKWFFTILALLIPLTGFKRCGEVRR